MKRTAAVLAVALLAVRLVAAAPGTRTILVLPFENESSNADLGWISEAFSEVLAARLSGPGRYVLDRDQRNAAAEQLGIPAGGSLTLASAYKVAETLGVDWAIVGRFNVNGDQLTASCQVLEVHNLKLTPPIETSGALADLIDVQTRLAWRLLATYDPDFTAGSADEFAKTFPVLHLDAFENYIRGLLATDDQTRLHFLQEAARIDPSDHRAALQLGRFEFEHKNYAASEAWLRKLSATDSGYRESLFLAGVDAFFTGEDAKSAADFSTLEKQVPLGEVINNLGVVEARQNHYEIALADFGRARQGDPLDPDFDFNVAACLWHMKRYGEATDSLAAAIEHGGDDPEAHTLMALVYSKTQNSAGYRRESAWLEAHEGGFDPHQDFTPELRLKKRYDGRAFGLLEVMLQNTTEARLSQEGPAQHGQVHLTEGQRYLTDGRLGEAERELDEAVSLLPSSSEGHLLLGQVYEADGRHSEAAAEFRLALQYDNSAITHLWLARTYVSLNQPSLALEQCRTALSMQPGNIDAQRLVDAIQARERSRP